MMRSGWVTGTRIRAMPRFSNSPGANRESLITLDKDFGELAVAFGQAHAGIVRLVDIHPAEQATACESVLSRHGDELAAGAIVTLARGRIRLRPAEPSERSDE